MNWLAFASIVGAAVAVSFGAIGPALAEGRAVAAAMDAIARQPESANVISRTLFVGLAMKASKGKANPAQLNDILKKKLEG